MNDTQKSLGCALFLTETELMLIEQGLKKNEAYLKGKYDELSKKTKENNTHILSRIMMARAELYARRLNNGTRVKS